MKKAMLLVSIILAIILGYFLCGKSLFVNHSLANPNQSVQALSNIEQEQNKKSRLDWGNWAAEFGSISETLNIDVFNIIVNMYENKQCGMNIMEMVEKIDLKVENTNFSGEEGKNQDYFITAGIKSDWWKDDALIILVFVHNEGKYKLACQYIHSSYKLTKVGLKDINTDTKSEIVIEEDFSGNQATDKTVRILEYTGSGFTSIFEESLIQCAGYFPYFYDNEYQFVRNNENPKLFDIIFTIKTGINRDLMDKFKDKNFEFPKPVSDEVVFIYNGQKYLPNKDVYDYRKPFEDYNK